MFDAVLCILELVRELGSPSGNPDDELLEKEILFEKRSRYIEAEKHFRELREAFEKKPSN